MKREGFKACAIPEATPLNRAHQLVHLISRQLRG
uniref:Uncharacterized protein n=1 Tax=Anopheles albimanus TaxID=7167 RepID=A0A182FZI5_ANOAL